MKDKYMLNTLLGAVLGVALFAAVMVRTFAPIIIMPRPDIPNLVLISLVALLLDHYLAPSAKRCWLCIALLSALSFGLLPFAACFVNGADAAELALMGSIVFTATTWLFSSVQERLSSGPNSKAAPIVSAFGLYLASQCFMGMFL